VQISQKKMRKFLSKKIQQLNDIVADLDSIVTEMGPEFYRVAIFGSARIKPDTDNYREVYDLAFALASQGVDIVTGGGPGLMEAANHGAKDGGKRSRSIGLPIELPFESDANQHLDVKYHHRRFSSRLDEFMRISHAIVITPGGIGTVLELFYTWQLLQVEHITEKPIFLLGEDMWSGLLEWLEKSPLSRGLLSKADLERLNLVNSVDEIIAKLEPELHAFKEQRKRETGK
jgi:uncharacterized protein (TIGR00730 family)